TSGGRPDAERRIREACKRLCPDAELSLLLRHEPQPWARPNCCWANVREQVRRCGGSPKYGWLLHLHPEAPVLIACSHAVWRRPEGEVVDLTPRRDMSLMPKDALIPRLTAGGGHPLWLPDPQAEDRPRKYLPLVKDKALARRCRLLSRMA